MHNGNVLTLPFTLGSRPAGSFDRLDAEGTAAKGNVLSIDDAALPGLLNSAAARENSIATPTELMKDLRFIHKALIDVSDGAEVGIESTRSGHRLLIPEHARAPRESVAEGDRCAFNAHARPKVLLNAHGVVESIEGGKATVRFDEGDRQRLIRATGKDYPVSASAPITILDKVNDNQ
ncbi:MAG TPA: hypothetical protein VGY76_10720 [Solirubrobacteraceae bacterium]|nr:hypothetical protein [Solirubrobacteraceae bacterium]